MKHRRSNEIRTDPLRSVFRQSPAVGLVAICLASTVQAGTLTTLYSFQGSQPSGFVLQSPVTLDPTGTFLYGETFEGGLYSAPITSGTTPIGNGILFKLAPSPSGGTPWVLTTLFNFNKQGRNPVGGLTLDTNTNSLIGATKYGGIYQTNDGHGNGTIFRFNLGTTGPEFTLLHNFWGPAGSDSFSSPIVDPSGNLIGATFAGGIRYNANATSFGHQIGYSSGAGVVYDLAPPTGASNPYSLLHRFNFDPSSVPAARTTGIEPIGRLAQDAAGNVYGVTNRGGIGIGGTVFRLERKTSGWVYQILYRFGSNSPDGNQPSAGVIVDAAGNVFGTTAYGGASQDSSHVGTVYKLTQKPRGGPWVETILHSFGTILSDGSQPVAELTMVNGVLYGTTGQGGSANAGTIFSLTPPAAGQTEWAYNILYSFQGGDDGSVPFAPLVADGAGNFYGTTQNGAGGAGTVFRFTP